MGRALPAVIFAAIIATIGLAGGEAVHQRILATEAVPDPDGHERQRRQRQPVSSTSGFVLPDGSLVGYDYFAERSPYDEIGNPKYPMVAMVVPGERYRFVETREAAALAGGSLVALLLAAFVVSRRRPG